MPGVLQSSVDVHKTPGSPDLFVVDLSNPMSANGRPIRFRGVLTWEDVLSLHSLLSDIVSRKTDRSTAVAPAQSKEGPPPLSKKKVR